MKLNNIDLNKLLVFSVVAESRTYGEASEQLGLTRSAISQAIAALESSLGFPLFDRVGKRVLLNDAGRVLHARVVQNQALLESTLSELSGGRQTPEGELRIGTHIEFAKAHLLPALTRFRRECPRVTVKLIFESPSRMRRLLERGKLDMVTTITAFTPARGLRCTKLLEEEMLLIAPSGWLRADAGLNEILERPLIDYYANHQMMRRWLSTHFRKKPQHVPIRFFAATSEIVLHMVSEGLGIGVVPDYLLRGPLAQTVSVIRPSRRQLKDHIWINALKTKEQLTAPMIQELVRQASSRA